MESQANLFEGVAKAVLEGCMRIALSLISVCLFAAAVVTLVAGVCATVGYFISTAVAVLAGIFGAGIGMLCAGGWLVKEATK